MLGLIVFSGFVVDYGVLWQSRRQAQNAADAGALAGAVARINDDQSANPSTTSGMVYESIVSTVGFNPIWGLAPPPSTVTMDWNCPDGTTNCVHVDVFRDGTHNSTTLPTFVMKVANIQSQGIKAHAIAQLVPANGTGCMRPWFMIDKYTDVNGDGMYTSPPDVYDGDPRDAGRPPTSYTGYQVPWAVGTTVTFHANLGPSGYGQVDVGSGGNAVNDAIENCVGNQVYKIGDIVGVKPGSTNGPEQQGVQQLITWDPGSSVSVTTNANGSKSATVVTSCAPQCTCPGNLNSVCPNGPQISPRVAIVPVCEPTVLGCASGGVNNSTIQIKEFLSFYIVSYSGNGNNLDITATLLNSAGQIVPMGGGTPGGTTPPTGAFLKAVVLIR